MVWWWSSGSVGENGANIALESWSFGIRPCSGQGQFTLPDTSFCHFDFFNLPLTAHKIMTPLEMFPLPQTSWTLLNCKIKNLLIIRRSQLQYSTLHQPQSTNSIIINIFNLTPLLPPHSPNVFLFTAVLIELKLTSKKKSSLDENTNDKNKNQNYTSSEQKSRSKN